MSEKLFENAYESDKREKDKATLYTSLEKRTIFMYGIINEKICSDVAYFIQAINAEDAKKSQEEKKFKIKPIKLYINSYGGSVYDMWAVIDSILTSKAPVHTYCTGYAMSAAFQIFISGKKRFISKHATLMYHQMFAFNYGKVQDLVEDQEHNNQMNSEIEKYVIERTKLDKDKLKNIREKKRDTYFTSEEAIKYGIADKILK